MEEKQEESQEQPREPLFSKSTLMIVGAFAVLNIAVVLLVFGHKIFGGAGEGEEAGKSVLEDRALIELGRIEVTKPWSETHENFVRCTVHIKLEVSQDRQQELETLVRQWDAKFKEVARRAFLDQEPQDLLDESLGGVKNAIKTRFNELLNEEGVIKDVVFGDYRTF